MKLQSMDAGGKQSHLLPYSVSFHLSLSLPSCGLQSTKLFGITMVVPLCQHYSTVMITNLLLGLLESTVITPNHRPLACDTVQQEDTCHGIPQFHDVVRAIVL